MSKSNNQKDFVKLSYKAKFDSMVDKHPAKVMLPLLTLGVLSVIAGVIMIAFYIESSSLLVSVGTGLAIIGGCIVMMALVLATMQRGKRTKDHYRKKNR